MEKEKLNIFYNSEILPHIADETDVIVDKIVDMVKKTSPKSNTDMIYVAYRLAKAAHKNQYRKSGDAYIIHPVQIAYIAAELSMDNVAICAALLHDVIEDIEEIEEKDIREIFGEDIASLVVSVTNVSENESYSQIESKNKTIQKVFHSMSGDVRTIIIKIADRLNNMRTLGAMKEEKQINRSSRYCILACRYSSLPGMELLDKRLVYDLDGMADRRCFVRRCYGNMQSVF